MSKIKLYPFQRQVAELVSSGQSVILQAPTGSGKTLAALVPFLNAIDRRRDFPTKCIYSVPMRVLARQFVEEYKKAVKYAGREDKIRVAIQTGDQPDDRELRSDLIFATIDQTLSSFLIAPYSLPKRKANINAAAVISAYLIFDEFHLYDPESTLPTTLHMLKMLQGITPFILMTATFSQDMLQGLADTLGATVVPANEDERQAMQTLKSQRKTRRYHVADKLTAETVLDQHTDKSLVICNTVDRARHVYERLRDQADDDVEVMLLHSRFLREDRDDIENRIRELFDRNATGTNAIVVSTQAIEVGVDISARVLHTELAPANAILQRAGRCARYECEEGDVYIYRRAVDPKDGETIDLCEKPAPYINQGDQFVATLAEFSERNGHELKFTDEQAIISNVHGPRDREILDGLKSGAYRHRQSMYGVMRGDSREDVRHLVRNIVQQQVTIHPDPDQLLDSPFDAPSFGLHPGTLQSYVDDWLERGNDLEWGIQFLTQQDDPEQTGRSIYDWDAVRTPETAKGAALLVVNPALASYDPQLGFISNRGGKWDASRLGLPQVEKRSEGRRYTYRLETYQTHIQHVLNACRELWPEMAHLATRLERHYGWEQGCVRRATELAVLLHDVGKLTQEWQGWVREYQSQIEQPVSQGQAYAHTELQTDWHREIEKGMRRRPWHAVEGALAVMPILTSAFPDNPIFQIAIYTAIAHHHTAHAHDNVGFSLIRSARHLVEGDFQAAKLTGVTATLHSQVPKGVDYLERNIIEPSDKPSKKELSSYRLYTLIVRVLRLADQIGTSRGAL